MKYECEFEAEVLASAIAPGWPERGDAELLLHVESCSSCAEIAQVASAIRQDLREAPITVPNAERVWWTAQLRARREAAERAMRPVWATQTLACAAGLGAIAVMCASYLGGAGLTSALAMLAQHSYLTACGALLLVGVPAAIYTAVARD